MAKQINAILQEELIKKGIVKKSVFDAILKESEKSNTPLISLLVKHNIAQEKGLLALLAEELKIPCVDLKNIEIETSLMKNIPIKLASYYKIMPIKLEGNALTIATSYPLDIKILDDIRMQAGFNIEIVLAPANEVEEAIKKYYGVAAETIERIISKTPAAEREAEEKAKEEKIEDIEKAAEDASIIKLVNQIIIEAFKKRATDIHIEPYRGKVRFRYRIDGVLYDANVPDTAKNFLLAILSRIKIMSNLNIVERRLPQDGRAIVKVQDQTLDLRISFIPTPFGESVVIRILPTTMFFDLQQLGLSDDYLGQFESFIERPHGIIFVTGPTGSGKTTTLYACLSRLNNTDKKIITIEDPIEYEMSGITQIQVATNIGLDFARGLRSMLRHDPDVMMVGEVRDLETAETAIRVALTGHLVFSTLHTNDAASGITRLIDIGVEPYLVASSVIAFVAQRLVRVNCPNCKKESADYPLEIKEMIAKDLNLKSQEDLKISKGVGCPTCNYSGFYGRTAIYEILPVNENIQNLIMKKSSSAEIRRQAVMQGMRTLRQDGWLKVLKGITTPNEVARVTQEEEEIKAPGKESTPIIQDTTPAESAKKEFPKSPADRRVYMRLDDRINIRFKMFKQSPGESLFGRKEVILENVTATKNISAGGILFISNEAPAIGSIIELKLEVPHRDTPIQCLARVVRVDTIEAKKTYNVAAAFLDISSKDRSDLDRYVREEMPER